MAEKARGEREVRIAAVGDLHYDGSSRGTLRDLLTSVNREADILVLCGDLTTHGRVEQAYALTEELATVQVPIIAVFGNHDYESDAVPELAAVLSSHGVHLLDGEQVMIQGVGFAGIKGFAGGFGRGTLAPFGEDLIKAFVQEAIDEALKLENALRTLTTDSKIVVMHYAPIEDTLVGEPEAIHPFLGSSRLLAPLETHGATVVFHGHAHNGTLEATTPGGIPVFNVALPLLQKLDRSYHVYTVRAPDRRREGS